MIRFKLRGFTLIEIIVVLAILASMSAVFIGFLMSSSKESIFSSDHFNSIVLSQKIANNIIAEMNVNPYGVDALGISSNDTTLQEVVDGQSVFFSHIEDRKQPWGEIDPLVDKAITKDMQPLYDSVKKFKFNLTSSRLADAGDSEDRNLVACRIKFLWKTKTGTGTCANSCDYFSPITQKKINLNKIVKQDKIDTRIPSEVFRKPTRSIPEIAAAVGENIETILALGRIALITRDFSSSDLYNECKLKIQNMKYQLANVPVTDYKNRTIVLKSIADTWYDLAKSSLYVISFLQPAFELLQAKGKFSTSSGNGFNAISFQQDLFYYRIIYEYFVGSLVQARYSYNKLLEKELVKYKGEIFQSQIILKLIDIYRVISIIPTYPTGMAEYRAFIKRLKVFSLNKNPSLYRMLCYEEQLLLNKQKWLKKFANLKVLYSSLHDKMPGILRFIKDKTSKMVTGK